MLVSLLDVFFSHVDKGLNPFAPFPIFTLKPGSPIALVPSKKDASFDGKTKTDVWLGKGLAELTVDGGSKDSRSRSFGHKVLSGARAKSHQA